MTVLTEETKCNRMRAAFGRLAGEYVSAGQHGKAAQVQHAAASLDKAPESLARLHDILMEAKL